MQTSRLGCLTSSGIFTGLLTAIVIVILAFTQGGVLFSPGPLNSQAGGILGGVSSHAELARDCGKCHVAPWDDLKMADRCTTCHVDVAVQMREAASLHGLMSHGQSNLKCTHCHPDHRGVDAPLTISSDDFPHVELGYSLTGHRLKEGQESFACRDCHQDGIARFDGAVCADCHRQQDAAFTTAHQSSWGGDCLNCHDGVDTYGSNFQHNDFDFQLTGRHVDIACVDCHAHARSIADLKSAQQACSACHLSRDVHAGGFGTDCGGCHTTDNWEDATFDHSKSSFPLTGSHQKVDCQKCHVSGQYAGLSSECVSCHADPIYHAGLFDADCQTCHDTNAWVPASFTGPHSFPFDHGEGGRVSCITCHPQSLVTYTCYGCHEHSEVELRSKHLEEGISDFQNCVECHPDGREHEGDN